MAMNSFDLPQEEDDTFEDHIEDEPYVEPPFDENVLTPEQKVKLDELSEENPTATRSTLAAMLRLNLVSHRAFFEGRELTYKEIKIAHALEEVIYWVPPTQFEGISDSTFEFCDCEECCLPCLEECCLPCLDEITFDFAPRSLITECLDLICETQIRDDLRLAKLVNDYHEVCFVKDYLSASNDFETHFSMLEESKFHFKQVDLGNELNVDKLLHEIELFQVEKDHENVTIVYYTVDGDNVDYSLENSFKPVVDFIFPPNTFDSHDQPTIKDYIMTYATFVVNSLDEKSVYYLWAVVCSFVHFVSCVCRRRTKGALAQPFDSCD